MEEGLHLEKIMGFNPVGERAQKYGRENREWLWRNQLIGVT